MSRNLILVAVLLAVSFALCVAVAAVITLWVLVSTFGWTGALAAIAGVFAGQWIWRKFA